MELESSPYSLNDDQQNSLADSDCLSREGLKCPGPRGAQGTMKMGTGGPLSASTLLGQL